MTLQNTNSERDQALARFHEKKEIMRRLHKSSENTAPLADTQIDHSAALLNQLKQTEIPGNLTRSDQRVMQNVAVESKKIDISESVRQRELNDAYKAKVLAKRLNREATPTAVDSLKTSEIASQVQLETKPIVASVDQNGSTILDDNMFTKVPETVPAATVNTAPITQTIPIMSEGTPALTEIASEAKKPNDEFKEDLSVVEERLDTGPNPTTPDEIPANVLSLAEQFGVAPAKPLAAPIAEVATPTTPILTPDSAEIPLVAPTTSTEVPTPESAGTQPIVPPAIQQTAEIPAVVAPPTAPVATEGAVSNETVSPNSASPSLPVDNSANHQHISSLPDDSFSSQYANIGGGGVALPEEEVKK
ncbi:MAG: hypothetical protein WCI57_03765 [Candidatus Berkelbacteria bacterium]